jgi:hypothetical protein
MAAEPISRRRFLRRTLLGAALLAVGGTALRHLSGYRLDERLARRLRVLSPKEAIVLGAACRRLLAADEAGAPSPDALGVVEAIDGYLAGLPPALAGDVRALIQLLEHSPFLFDLRASRFTHLDDAGQDAVLAAWAGSRLELRRQGFAALKSLAALGYYGDARTFAILDYQPMQIR